MATVAGYDNYYLNVMAGQPVSGYLHGKKTITG